MLKILRGLFLGLVVLAGSACVTPTHASSAPSVIITYVQAGGATGAKEELIELYNSSSESVDVTDACFVNKSNVAFACFASNALAGRKATYTVLPGGYISIASEEYVAAHIYPRSYYSLIYTVTNQSSGSIVSSADSISFVNSVQDVMTSRTWTTSLLSGKAWVRMKLITQPVLYANSNESTDWTVENASEPPLSALAIMTIPSGEIPGGTTGDGTTTTGPTDTTPSSGDGTNPPTPITDPLVIPLSPVISELLPNPTGADADGEYIELYNPNDTTVISLDGYKLRIGTDSPKWYNFPTGSTIPPKSYSAFWNSELGFTLVNTTGQVQLFKDTAAIGEVINYTSPKDNQAWALIEGSWMYTMNPTPGGANELVLQTNIGADTFTAEANLAPKPCAANQYRSLDTGRCKLISTTTASSTPTPCKEGQERNPETNRCRNIVIAAAPTPCKEGQERNPETNRCRAIVKMTDANYKVQGVQGAADTQPRWYYWLAIIIIVLLVLSYAVWEWREELRNFWARLLGLVRK